MNLEDGEVSHLIRVKVLVLLYLCIYVCLCLLCQRMMLVTWSVSRSSSSFFITSGVGTLSSSSSLSVSISCVDKEIFLSETKGIYSQFSDEEHEVCWWYVGHLQLNWWRRRWSRTGRGRRCRRTWWGAAHTSWGRGIIIINFKHRNISSKWKTFFRRTIISNMYSGNLVRRVVVRCRNSTNWKQLPPGGGWDGGGAGRGKDGKGGASTRSTWVRTKNVITIIYSILYISYKKGGKGEASTRLTWVRSSYYKRRILSL